MRKFSEFVIFTVTFVHLPISIPLTLLIPFPYNLRPSSINQVNELCPTSFIHWVTLHLLDCYLPHYLHPTILDIHIATSPPVCALWTFIPLRSLSQHSKNISPKLLAFLRVLYLIPHFSDPSLIIASFLLPAFKCLVCSISPILSSLSITSWVYNSSPFFWVL